jgi:hypothetical protein
MRTLGYLLIIGGVLLLFTIILFPIGLMMILVGAVLVGVGTYVAKSRVRREHDELERSAQTNRKRDDEPTMFRHVG